MSGALVVYSFFTGNQGKGKLRDFIVMTLLTIFLFVTCSCQKVWKPLLCFCCFFFFFFFPFSFVLFINLVSKVAITPNIF